MAASTILFFAMAALSHWLFGWDVVWGADPTVVFNLADQFSHEDVGFVGDHSGFLIRVKDQIFGLVRELPPPLGAPRLNSTPLAWICLGLTFWLPAAALED